MSSTDPFPALLSRRPGGPPAQQPARECPGDAPCHPPCSVRLAGLAGVQDRPWAKKQSLEGMGLESETSQAASASSSARGGHWQMAPRLTWDEGSTSARDRPPRAWPERGSERVVADYPALLVAVAVTPLCSPTRGTALTPSPPSWAPQSLRHRRLAEKQA